HRRTAAEAGRHSGLGGASGEVGRSPGLCDLQHPAGRERGHRRCLPGGPSGVFAQAGGRGAGTAEHRARHRRRPAALAARPWHRRFLCRRAGAPRLRQWLVATALAVCAAAIDAAAAETPATGSTEVLFSPWDDAEGGLIAALAQARQSIHVQAYLLTSRNIAKALLQAHRRGVEVRIL